MISLAAGAASATALHVLNIPPEKMQRRQRDERTFANGTGNPNSTFDVFDEPYRDTHTTKQQMFFDEVKFTDIHSEGAP